MLLRRGEEKGGNGRGLGNPKGTGVELISL
jgi:hypothetical protein